MSIPKAKKYLQDIDYFSRNGLYKFVQLIYNSTCVGMEFRAGLRTKFQMIYGRKKYGVS